MLGLIIAVGVVAIALAIYFGRYRPAPTHQITDNVYAVACGPMNFYALKTDKGVVLFDTSMNPFTTKRCLAKIGVAPETVTHIFLTHTDFDHAGGVFAFPHAQWYIARPEEQMINGETARRLFVHNKRLPSYRALENGDTVSIDGNLIKIYIVPGHTPGSAAYLINDRFLVSGDLLRVSAQGKFVPFFWFINMNHQQNIESIERMKPLIEKTEYLLTGHTGVRKSNHGQDAVLRPLDKTMKFKLMFKTRIPLSIRRKKGMIYFQLQLDVIDYGTMSVEFSKIETTASLSALGQLTLELLSKFKKKPELQFDEIAGITQIERTDWEEIRTAISEKRLAFMDARDSNELERTCDSCCIQYLVETDLYEFYLTWMYREGNRWYHDGANSTGDPEVATFDERLAFTDATPPEEVGRMLLDALDRSRQMANMMSGGYCPPKNIELLSEGVSVSCQPPKDKHFVDAGDYGAGEIYQGYSYLPNEDSESVAEFYLGIAAELNCNLAEENVRLSWEKYDGKADFFAMKEAKHQLFTFRAEMKNKNIHRISYLKKMSDDELLECAMTVKRPNQRKKLDEKLAQQFEEFAFGCVVNK